MYALRLLTYTPLATSFTRHIYTTNFIAKNHCKGSRDPKKSKNTTLGKSDCNDKLKKELKSGNKCCSPVCPKKPKSQRSEVCKKKDACISPAVSSTQKTCPEKPDIPQCGAKDPATECMKNLQEIRNASALVAEEAQKALKDIETASRCLSQRKEQPKSACQPRRPPQEKSCGKFAYLCYLLGIAFLLNLGYCVYKHSEDQTQQKRDNRKDKR